MMKTNVFGSLIICLILFSILGMLLYMGLSINWEMYFKTAAIVLLIAAVMGIAAVDWNKR